LVFILFCAFCLLRIFLETMRGPFVLFLVNMALNTSFFFFRTWWTCFHPIEWEMKRKLALFIWYIWQFLLSFCSFSCCNFAVNQAWPCTLQCYLPTTCNGDCLGDELSEYFFQKFIWGRANAIMLQKCLPASHLLILIFRLSGSGKDFLLDQSLFSFLWASFQLGLSPGLL
jgi:hypothetical protein